MNITSLVDTHVHLWNPGVLRYPWLDDLPALNRAWLPADFASASQAVNVTKLVFVECGREPGQSLAEVDWIESLVPHEPRLRGIVAHAALEQGATARAELARLAERPLVKGVRRLLQGETEADFCLRPDFIAGVRLLAEFGFTFDLCIRHEQLRAVSELVRRVPEVRFVLDHLGKPPVRAGQVEPWAAELRALATLPNVSCKLSGLLTEADWQLWRPEQLQPFIEVALEAFGFDRVLFGGDWPVLNLAGDYSRWLGMLEVCLAGVGEGELQKLFRINAENFYHV
jgi:L-fuconolactonase